MTKDEHINYWKTSSEKDWSVVFNLYKSKDYVYSLFFSHLTIEKLAKALWVKNNDNNHPPRIHNIVSLLERADIEMPDEIKEFLLILNDFQLEGRYPDYRMKIFKICDKQRTDEMLKDVKKVRIWLLEQL
ncbi:MAG: HEPN domain-containing protein [Bacteroidales bacterium]|nr:HEPN domain-containing protein [Bacteroidales bacterium]